MNRALVSRLVYVLLLAGIGLVLGCGGDRSLVKVSGNVTVDGKPLSGGSVTFIPDVALDKDSLKKASKLETGGISGGKINEDGTYKIYTGGKEGAPPGKYKVTVTTTAATTPDPDAKDPPALGFDKKYADVNKTPLRKEVVAAPAAGQYDLELTSEKK